SGQVGKDEIARIINEEPDLVAACKALIDRANENGGPDNITVIAARFDGSRLNPPGMSDEVGHRVFPLPETGQTAAVSADIITAADEPPSRSSRPTTRDPGAAIPEEVVPLPAESLGAYPPPPEVIDFSTAPTPVTG